MVYVEDIIVLELKSDMEKANLEIAKKDEMISRLPSPREVKRLQNERNSLIHQLFIFIN